MTFLLLHRKYTLSSKIPGAAGRFFASIGNDMLEIAVRTNGIPKFTGEGIEALAKAATKNGSKTKVMLGKESFNGTIPYFDRAGTDYKYFRFDGDGWSNLFGLIDSNVDEMWKVNKKFIDEAKAKGDQIFLSHDPYDPLIRQGFYKMELDYIEGPTMNGRIDQISEDLWKVTF